MSSERSRERQTVLQKPRNRWVTDRIRGDPGNHVATFATPSPESGGVGRGKGDEAIDPSVGTRSKTALVVRGSDRNSKIGSIGNQTNHFSLVARARAAFRVTFNGVQHSTFSACYERHGIFPSLAIARGSVDAVSRKGGNSEFVLLH